MEASIYKENEKGTYFIVKVKDEKLSNKLEKFSNNGIFNGELRIDDNRFITSDQRKKIYATLGDIAIFTGECPKAMKEILKYYYIGVTGEKYFSLSDCSITTAKEFINFILGFALFWDIPLTDVLLNRTDDIDKALYISLLYKKCAICGQKGEMHHVDRIGMGRNRNKIDDSNFRKICLCRKHHTEAHLLGNTRFEEKYHVYGIIFN